MSDRSAAGEVAGSQGAETGGQAAPRVRDRRESPNGTHRRLTVFTDGGARGNPGPGAWAAVISDERGNVLRELSRYLGPVTNNQAEYRGLIEALAAAKEYRPEVVAVFMDSELVVNQMNGRYQVRHPNMRPLYEEARALAATFPSITFEHVTRDRNRQADRLVNAAIDSALSREAEQPAREGAEPSRPLPRMAFVGLGHMGAPMAANLLRAGYPLTVFNRTRDKEQPLLKAGANSAADVAEAVRQVDVILTCLRDPTAVREMYLGPAGILSAVRAGQTLVDHGTTGIALTQELARRAESLGAHLLDAPISGGVAGAEAATLSIMVGGERQAFEELRPAFEAMGKTIRYVGPSGSGQALKLVNQLLVIVHQLAAVEAFALAEKAGVSADVFGEVIPNSWGQSRMLELILPRLVKRSFGDSGPSLWAKDEQLIEEAAADLHQPIPLLQAARKLVDQGIGAGLSMADLAAALQLYELGAS